MRQVLENLSSGFWSQKSCHVQGTFPTHLCFNCQFKISHVHTNPCLVWTPVTVHSSASLCCSLTSGCQHCIYSSLRDMTSQKEALQSVLQIMNYCIKKILSLMWVATCKTCPACCTPPHHSLGLCLVAFFIPFKKLSALSMRGACGGELCDRIYWLGETKTKIKQKWQRENGWFQVEQPACVPLIWIPGEKVQVTESLLKQTANGGERKPFICFFLLQRAGKKNRKYTESFSTLFVEKKRLFCDALEW